MKTRNCFLPFVYLLLLETHSAEAYVFPDKAIVDIPIILDAIAVEKELGSKGETNAPNGTSWFQVIKGSVPIVVTAPHATRPFREGQYRFADGPGTAALAVELNKLTGVTVIYTTYFSPSDPNYYDDNDFKKALKTLIQETNPILILDIHGSSPYRPYDVDLGTMDGNSLLGKEYLADNLIPILRSEGLQNISYNYFGASKNQTITKFASDLKTPAIQLEINSTWLTPSESDINAHRFSELLQAMVKYIQLTTAHVPNK